MQSQNRRLARLLPLAGALCCTAASAQFGTAFPGFVQLPDNDFTWYWGDADDGDVRGAPDFRVRGSEGGFRCDLTGRMRISSRMSSSDIRNLEQSLSASLAFIQVSAETMTVLERRIDLDWGRLACEKLENDTTAEEEQERLDRALEKAVRDRERRRARENDDN
jgi:hypothetical protein